MIPFLTDIRSNVFVEALLLFILFRLLFALIICIVYILIGIQGSLNDGEVLPSQLQLPPE